MGMQKIEYLIKHNAFVQKAYVVVMSAGFRFIGLFIKKNPHQVFFQSLIGRNYGDSPKIIFDAMRSDPDFKDFKYVWAFVDPDKFSVPDNTEKVGLNSLKYFTKAIQSGVWVCNVNIERGLLFKPRKTVFLNTGHGGQFKVDGNAQKNRNDYDYSDVDMFCSFSKFDEDINVRDYKVRREACVICGVPRDDELYHVTPETVKQARKKLGIPDGKKVILYAPTWRDSSDGGENYSIAPPMDIALWRKKLSKDYVLLFRAHHLTTKSMNLEYDDFVINGSLEQNVNTVLVASDILITDYSSIAYDYSILERPIVDFAYDYEEYKNTRGLNEELEVMFPGSVFFNQEQILEHILTMDFEEEKKKTIKVKERYVQGGGNATQVCMNFIKTRLGMNESNTAG